MAMTPSQDLLIHYVQWHQRRLVEALRRFRFEHSGQDEMVLAFLFARHWLVREVHPNYRTQVAAVLASSGYPAWASSVLMDRAFDVSDADWIDQIGHRLADGGRTVRDIASAWQGLGLFATTTRDAVRHGGRVEKKVMEELGGPQDRRRMALVDALEERDAPVLSWEKMAFIPRMACPQSCRHCMFIWRPPLKNLPDFKPLFKTINHQTTNLLFTGGDLTKDLDLFYDAIATMDRVETFAILLNGQLARSQEEADLLFARLHHALGQRPSSFAGARVVVQISCDEYHQEILANRHGALAERIPVAHCARLIIAGAGSNQCQVALVHKQNSLNFSTQLFQKGVMGRLLAELKSRNWNVDGIQWHTSPRPKEHPSQPSSRHGVICEAMIALVGPGSSATMVHFVSSCIEPQGRAETLDRSEYVHEKLVLQEWLAGHPPRMDPFDWDPMVWRNGHVTVFGAIHLWMGNYFEEGMRVFSRLHKDPLIRALQNFDLALIGAYRAYDPERHRQIMQTAVSPHGVLHAITREAEARLFLTQWLLEQGIPSEHTV
ncbi:MAG: hypothetical protein HQL07_14405 [Nitrospirae bacterium]|nr:hypothetical protein [Magnetococcales bacterium]